MKKYFSLLSVLAIGILATGCSMGDAYNENANKEASDAAFVKEFGDIASNQTWNTVTQRTATVNVSLGTGESYTVGIYENDPLFNVSNCGLLAQGTVSDGSSVSLKFDSPAEQNHYYVGLFDSKGRSRVQIDSLLNNQMTANFGGSSSSAKSTTRVATRGTASSTYAQTWSDRSGGLDPATMRTSSEYKDLSDVPSADLQKMTDSGNTGQFHGYKYKVKQGETFTGSFAIQNGVLFVDGTLDLSGSDNLVFNRSKLVISSTGKVILHKDVSMTEVETQLLIEAGGQLVSDGNYTFVITNGGSSYSAGTISMPNGTFNFNGTDLYNCGNINVNNLISTAGGAKLTNFGKVDSYTNDPYNAGAYNCTYINCCYMKFDHCNIGNSSVLTDNSRIDITNRLYITGTNTFGNASKINAGEMYLQGATFNGPTGTGEFAIIKNAGKMHISWTGDGIFNNNIYLDWDKTELYNNKGVKYTYTENDYIYGFIKGIPNWTSEATSSLIIPSGDCTGTGNNSKGGGGDIPTTAPACTFAFEDLGSIGDFDFNDIVLYVYPNTTTKKMDVELVAAGGVLPVTVKFNGTTLFSKTDGQMRNTSSKGSVIATYNDLPFPDDNFTLSSNTYTSMFTIDVKGASSTYTISPNVTAGSTPQALVIAGAWAWPKETVNIGKAYTTFSDWVANPTVTWVTSKVSGQVVE